MNRKKDNLTCLYGLKRLLKFSQHFWRKKEGSGTYLESNSYERCPLQFTKKWYPNIRCDKRDRKNKREDLHNEKRFYVVDKWKRD